MYTKKEVEEKVRARVSLVINAPEYRKEFAHLCSSLNFTREDIANAAVIYDVYLDDMNNTKYSDMAMRAAMRALFLTTGSYHQKREQTVLDYLKKIKPASVCEIGFGIPTKWVRELALNGGVRATLIDMDSSAQEFSKVSLDHFDVNEMAGNYINYETMNMDDLQYPGDFDVYVMMDSIEHTKDPTSYLRMLTAQSKETARFIFSIPIGLVGNLNEDFHYIEWATDDAAKQWLNKAGLKIIDQRKAVPNPEVDLFIHSLNKSFHNLLLLCEKREALS